MRWGPASSSSAAPRAWPRHQGSEHLQDALPDREEGKFFIRDLGSTNGIEHHGVRVDDHRIEEGAIYHLCDHELRCTYKRPR